MPSQADVEFLRSAVACGALAPQAAREVLAALRQVEKLGASSSARELAVNRGHLTREQAETAAASTPSATPAPARPGGHLANFVLISKIGSGGMGVVFEARQLTTGRHVALKVLPRRFARDRAYVERFLREARAAARLDHPNIVRAIDAGEARGRYYFAMELVAGESLKERLRRLGRLAEREAVEMARQVALALEHAGARGFVHRDIKPANILITPDGVVKLADLGLARHDADHSLTLGGAPIGTPLYMSPEQARGRDDVDIRSDIYSLGATLYHAATGSPPFIGPNATAVIAKHLFERPRPPRELVPELSEGLSLVVLKMMAKRPADRYESPARLIRDLERLADGREPLGAVSRASSHALRRARRRARRRTRSPLAALVASAMVFACLAGLWCLFSALAGESRPRRRTSRPAQAAPPQVAAPKPRPQPRAPGTDPALSELQRVLERARAKPGKPEEVIRSLRRVAARYPGTAAAASAQREVARLRREAAERQQAAFDEIVAEARELCGRERFAEAASLLDAFAGTHGDLAHAAGEERGRVVSQALARERQLRDQAQRLTDGGDFASAIALYRRVASFGLPQLAARAGREAAILEARQAEAERQALAKARDHYLALRLRLRPLLAARRYGEAGALLKEALARSDLKPLAPDLLADLRDLESLLRFWEAVARGARALRPGETFSVGGIKGRFQRFQKGEIEIRASGVPCRKPLDALKTSELLALAGRAVPDEKSLATASALFLLAEGKAAAAQSALARAEKDGADASHYRALVARWRADGLEAGARDLLARAQEAANQEQWDQVTRTIAALRKDCAATRTSQASRRRIEQLAVEARCATLTVADLFKGAARSLPDGRLSLSYDFSDPTQLADWDLVGGSHTLGNGSLVLTGAQAFHRAALDPPIDLTVELADASGPPGEWSVGLGPDTKTPLPCSVLLPERPGLPLSLMVRGRAVATARATFAKGRSRAVSLALRPDAVRIELDARPLADWQLPPGVTLGGLKAAVGSSGQRKVSVASIGITAAVSQPWAEAELARVKAQLRKNAALAAAPWQPLFDGVALTRWHDPKGAWAVAEGAATTQDAGTLALRKLRPGDFELRLKVRPASAATLLGVRFRAAQTNQRYAVLVGGQPPHCRILYLPPRANSQEELARENRLDWQGGRWYDLRVVALGPELAVELDGSTVATARDPRLKAGALSLEVLRGAAALKDMALRVPE